MSFPGESYLCSPPTPDARLSWVNHFASISDCSASCVSLYVVLYSSCEKVEVAMSGVKGGSRGQSTFNS